MQITKELLNEKQACSGGMKWFSENFPEGGEYQSVLDALAKENRTDYASWLMQNMGKTDAVLQIVGDLVVECGIFFAGSIKVSGAISAKMILAGSGIKAGDGIEAGSGIKAGSGIEAGWGIEAGSGIKAGDGIEAGWGIKAGDGIEAGWGIKAGDGIEAGDDFGIYAGLRIRVSQKAAHALVIAKELPKNLLLGIFKALE